MLDLLINKELLWHFFNFSIFHLFPSKQKRSSAAALTAVAFQDHLVRNLNLDLSLSNLAVSKKVNASVQRNQLKSVKAVVDTGKGGISQKQTRPIQEVEEEYVLDPEPKPLTLGKFVP